jgi:hypothetical protein
MKPAVAAASGAASLRVWEIMFTDAISSIHNHFRLFVESCG